MLKWLRSFFLKVDFLWDFSEWVTATQGEVMSYPSNPKFLGLCTDSRKEMKDKAFLALKGDVFDGHDYIDEALKSGARALILDRSFFRDFKNLKRSSSSSSSIGIIQVEDTLKALQSLATFYRKKKLLKAKVVAISGSNGKTSTKEFLKCLLQTQSKVFTSPKNFNNHFGVPLSLLQAPPESEVVVLEMGMNHKGELSQLCHIAKPDFALITTVGEAHSAFLGSIENIAEAKEELYLHSSEKTHFIFNRDNLFTARMYEKYKQQRRLQKCEENITSFSSREKKADVFFEVESMNWDFLSLKGHIRNHEGVAKVPVFGRQNSINLMAASALSLSLGMAPQEIWEALPLCQSLCGRNQKIELKSGISVLFDAYNANPESVGVLLENLKEVQFQKEVKSRKKNGKGKNKAVQVTQLRKIYAVFGEMMELGKKSELCHYQWGKKAGSMNFEGLWFIGQSFEAFREGFQKTFLSKVTSSSSSSSSSSSPVAFDRSLLSQASGLGKNFYFTKNYESSVVKKIASLLKKGDLLILKGSRGMRLERFLMDIDVFSEVSFAL